jgi:hypothetical protein
MKITGGYPQPIGRRPLKNHCYRQLIVNTWGESAAAAADPSAAFTMTWNQRSLWPEYAVH